jgi:hypothetical protein
MIVLDKSGSMDMDPTGGFSSPSKLDIAKMAINTLIMKYGDRIPFGFTTFNDDGSGTTSCTGGINILVQPKHGTGQMITAQVAAVTAGAGTNTGEAVAKVAADPAMHDASRPGSYILLITDGEPNCGTSCTTPGTTTNVSSEPQYSACEVAVAAAATSPIKTFVIGFGALPTADQMAMDLMADAGQEPCMGSNCNGHKYYAADSAQALNDAIDAISQQISGEFGGVCDDSCYSNGCQNAGEICVAGMCKSDPCANVTTCAPGDYCYTDGNSPGTCVHACPMPCASGEVCTPQGTCQTDPCATISCPQGQVCHAGNCVNDSCNTGMNAKPCDPGLLCLEGSCVDDPCRYVTCPTSTMCVTGTGACAATLTSGGGTGGGHQRGGKGCDFGLGGSSSAGVIALCLLAVALALRARRRHP